MHKTVSAGRSQVAIQETCCTAGLTRKNVQQLDILQLWGMTSVFPAGFSSYEVSEATDTDRQADKKREKTKENCGF